MDAKSQISSCAKNLILLVFCPCLLQLLFEGDAILHYAQQVINQYY